MKRTFFLLLLITTVILFAQSKKSIAAAKVKARQDSILQADSLKLKKYADSLQAKQIYETHRLTEQRDSVRIQDSIKRVNLLKEIENLKTNEVKKKKALEQKMLELTKADSLRADRAKKQIDSLRKITKGYPVVPFLDTLFYIYTRIGPFSAEQRAENVKNRIIQIEKSYISGKDSLHYLNGDQTTDLFYNDQIVLSISEQDAFWANKNGNELADFYIKTIVSSIENYRQATSWITLLKKIGLSLLVIVIQFYLIKGINLIFRRINSRIQLLKDNKLNGISFKDYQLIDSESQTKMVVFFVNLVRYLIIAILLYLTIPILFSIYPQTKQFAVILFDYVLSPVKNFFSALISYIPNIISIIVIYLITRYIVKMIHFLSKEIEDGKLKIGGFYPDWAKPTFNIVRFLIYAFMFIMIYPFLPGSDSPIFQGVSVFLGIIFSLGSSSVIGNMVAGLVITYMRPFKIGDRVKVGDIVGNVTEKTPFVTRIRTPKNELITIPNSSILNHHTVNYSASARDYGLIMHTTITIGYDVPWTTVHDLLIQAAKSVKNTKSEPAPFVLQTSLDDFYVSYQINLVTEDADKQAIIQSDLHQNIQDKFNEAGIEIMSPHYNSLRNGGETAIPSNYFKNSKVPFKNFNVKIEKD